MTERIAFLGGDISKGHGDFVFLNSSMKEICKPLHLTDSAAGHKILMKTLNGLLASKSGFTQIKCAVESTGGYESNWYYLLKNQPSIQVAMLNPYPVSKTLDADMTRSVTDKVSAHALAEYQIRFQDKVTYYDAAKESNLEVFKPIHSEKRLLTKQRTQLKNHLEKLLYQAFPEFLAATKGGWPAWAWSFLAIYPTADCLSKVKGQLREVKYAKESTLKALRAKVCKGSIAGKSGPHIEYAIKACVSNIQHLNNQIKEVDKYIAKHIISPQIDLLCSIPGVGKESAFSILIEIGDIKRFASPEKLAAFFGLQPSMRVSGDKKGGVHMSKQGSAMMRATLYMCAKNVALHDTHFKEIHDKRRKLGWSYNKTMGLIMHKLARVMWGMMTHEQVYDPKVDKANQDRQMKAEGLKTVVVLDAQTDNFQNMLIDAPISRRYRRKNRPIDETMAGHSELGAGEQQKEVGLRQIQLESNQQSEVCQPCIQVIECKTQSCKEPQSSQRNVSTRSSRRTGVQT